jgi:hypothetical protein
MTTPRNSSATRFQAHGWHGWAHADWQDLPEFQDIDAWLREEQSTLILELLCRRITRHESARGALYAKYMRAKNDAVIKKREPLSYLRWYLLPSRGQRIFLTCMAMLQKGHYCPQPVLGARCRRGALKYPHELFVSAELLHPTVEELLHMPDVMSRDEILALCGKELRRFHADDFVHGDFLPRNACIDISKKRLFYLDNDRTKLWSCPAPFYCQRRNLAQFCYNLLLQAEGYDLAMPDSFLHAYLENTPWPEKKRRQEYQRIVAQIHKRWQRHGEKEAARLRQSPDKE